MKKYLSKKYFAYSQKSDEKPFILEHIIIELLCTEKEAKTHFRKVIKRSSYKFNFQEFSTIIKNALEED